MRAYVFGLDSNGESAHHMRMDSTALRANAVLKRDAALAEAKRWDDFVRQLDELEGTPTLTMLAAVGAVDARPALRPSAIRKRAGIGANTEDYAAAVIRNAGPQTTSSMLALLTQEGHHIGGANPQATLHSRLSRAQSLEYVKGIGWRLKEQPSQKEETPGAPLNKAPEVSGLESGPPSDHHLTSATVNPVGGGGT